MKITIARECVFNVLKTPKADQKPLRTWVSIAGFLGKLYDEDVGLTGTQRTRAAKKRVVAFVRKHFTTTETSKILTNKKKENENFYDSKEWQKARYFVLRKYGGKCQLCGRSYKEDGIVIHVDHIKPRSKYPELELDKNNLQVLCKDCNLGKMARDEIDWR